MRQEDNGEEDSFRDEPDFDGKRGTVDTEGRRQKAVEQENAVEEADRGDVVEEDYAASYKDILWGRRPNHRDSFSL